MTTVKAFIRTGKKDKEVNVRFRLSDGRSVQLFHKSEIMVSPILWDAKTEKAFRDFLDVCLYYLSVGMLAEVIKN